MSDNKPSAGMDVHTASNRFSTVVSGPPAIPTPPEELPLDWVYRWEKERPRKVYLTQPFQGQTREWTWSQAMREARCIASYLIAQEWPPGSNIAILSRNCAWWMMAELAIWMSGHVTVPLYSSFTASSTRALLEHCEAKACFVGAVNDLATLTEGVPQNVRCIRFPVAPELPFESWDFLVAHNPPLKASPIRLADDIATIVYTSGTTGAPKGAVHRFRAFSYFARAVDHVIPSRREERLFSYLPLAHIAERALIETQSFHQGSHVFFCAGLETFLADLKRAKPTIFFSVPRLYVKFQYHVLARISQSTLDTLLAIPVVGFIVRKYIQRALGLHKVRIAASGAAPMPPNVLRWFRKIGLNLVEGYGMTETGITHTPERGHSRPGYVGNGAPGVQTRIAQNGEILVKSPMNMLGYYKDPENTRCAFTEDGFFRTGDVGELDEDGWLKVTGRVKEQFKTAKGEYIAPCPIEKLLCEHAAIELCAVMGSGAPCPFAAIMLSAEAQALSRTPDQRKQLEDALRTHFDRINSQLEPHQRLAFLIVSSGPWSIENGLITPTMKVRRATVESRYARLAGCVQPEQKIQWEDNLLSTK